MKASKAYFLSLAKSILPIWVAFTVLITTIFVLATCVFNSFVTSNIYSTIVTLFPMVYAVVVGNKLVAEKIDKGTMSGYLIASNSRVRLATVSAIYFVVSTFVMWVVASVVGIVAGLIAQKEMDVPALIALNGGAFLYHIALCGVCFLSSCIFNTSKSSLALGGGICVAFYLFGTLNGLVDSLEFLKYLTPATLYDTMAIFAGESIAWQFSVLGISGVVLMGIGVAVFNKKDLPI